MSNIAPPAATEYPPAVAHYVALVPGGNLINVLGQQADQLRTLVRPLNDEQALVHHPPYTWSIKQVVGHMTDCDRVFGYRTLRIARNDATPLSGFDENAYMQAIDFDGLPLADLLAEFEHLRRSHVLMLSHLAADAWLRHGVVNGHAMSARAAAYVMAGHTEHHLRILQKRLAPS